MNIAEYFNVKFPQYIGRGTINGNIIEKPQANLIYKADIYNQSNKSFIGSFICDEQGNFVINDINVKNNTFFIIAHHPENKFNGVIADNIGG